ncbi:helix-turn-helix domain-containing protein [Streptosporangium sp. V21-05]|uniref:helix-turn-helix domain-containing protein n=1 Tax=Streptosporangium sp. V21-05 TaxID=3446115 RepID=UPI003F52FDC1
MSEIPVGERVQFYRKAQKKKQAVVAGLAGITEDYLSQIERGLKTPAMPLLHRLARVLNVPVSALLGEPAFEEESAVHPVGRILQRALTSYVPIPSDRPLPDLAELRERVNALWALWQTSPTRFTDAAPLVPDLVRDVQFVARALRSGGDAATRRDVYRMSADLYFFLRTFTKRIGRPDLSLLVADRGMVAAEEADDPLRVAVAKWNLGQILLSQSEAEGAEEVALYAIESLRHDLPSDAYARTAMEGALWLVATVAAARRGDFWTARDRLRENALPAAQRSGDGNVLWTVFGVPNVGLHAVSVEVEAGETAEALRLADDVAVSRLASLERRTTFALEVARCYEQRRDDAAVFLHLLTAEASGPEDLRYNVLARDLIRGLLKRARPTYAPQVQALAQRVGLLAG